MVCGPRLLEGILLLMLPSNVYLHVAELGELFTALAALVWPLAGVQSHVSLQIDELRKRPSAPVAGVRPEVLVNGHHVPLEAVRIGRRELPRTYRTLHVGDFGGPLRVRQQEQVDAPPMVLQVATGVEPHSAVLARIGPLSGVQSHMGLEVPQLTEALLATAADERFDATVRQHVTVETVRSQTADRTLRTLGFLAAVRHHVLRQVPPVGERLVADDARRRCWQSGVTLQVCPRNRKNNKLTGI